MLTDSKPEVNSSKPSIWQLLNLQVDNIKTVAPKYYSSCKYWVFSYVEDGTKLGHNKFKGLISDHLFTYFPRLFLQVK